MALCRPSSAARVFPPPVIFLSAAVLVGVRVYLGVAVMCVSLMADNVELFSVHLLATCICFFVEMSVRSPAHF